MLIPLVGLVCRLGTVVEVVVVVGVVVVVVVEVVVVTGKPTETATFFQASFLPDFAQT